MRKKLRVGILLDDLSAPRWATEIITHICENEQLNLSLIVRNTYVAQQRKRSFLGRVLKNNYLYYRWLRFDRRRLRASNDEQTLYSLKDQLAGVPMLDVEPLASRYVDRFPEADVAQIRSHDLDILIRFGFRIIKGEILNCARYGVWSYHHGDNSQYRGGPAGFWEVYDGNPITGATLQVLTESLDAGYVLGKTYTRTHPTSPLLNKAVITRASIALFIESIERVLRERPSQELFFRALNAKRYQASGEILHAPTNRQMLIFLARIGMRMILARLPSQRIRRQWSIAVIPEAPHRITQQSLSTARWVVPDQFRSLADPFLAEVSDRTFVFVEDYSLTEKRGHIAVLDVDDSGQLSNLRPVLRRPFHLSYPFIFMNGSEYFMIPEQAESGKVVLYRSSDFPEVWQEEAVLLDDFPGIDTNILFRDDLWWLFTTNSRYGNQENNLYLFFAESLHGPYRPHPDNPVKRGLEGTRNAGPLIKTSEGLMRPGQDCVRRYGAGIIWNRVTSLSVTKFAEEPMRRLAPSSSSQFGSALHTIGGNNNVTVIDGLR